MRSELSGGPLLGLGISNAESQGINRDDNMPAAITGHNYGNFYVGSYTVSVSYPSDTFHTQGSLHGLKEVLTVSLSFFLCL